MATGYTQHYGLCQWAGEDKFLREEFNGDNEKLDAAVKAASAGAALAAAGLEGLSYNVYNLMLQSYYDGKQTGHKKALLFDGFKDGGGIASKDAALVLGGNALTLSRSIAQPVEQANGGQGEFVSNVNEAAPITAPGAMILRRLTLVSRNAHAFNAGAFSIALAISVNGVQKALENHTLPFYENDARTTTVSLRGDVVAASGDTVSVTVGGIGGSMQMPAVSGDNRKLYAVYGLDPLPSSTVGTMAGHGVQMPACGGLLGWVRHRGGTVELFARAGGRDRALTAVGSRSAVDLQGKSCSETAFRLGEPLVAGSLAAVLRVSLGTGENQAALLDYGVALV